MTAGRDLNGRPGGLLAVAAIVLAGAASPAGAGLAGVTVTNESTETFCTAYVSPHGHDAWSEHALGPGCLRPGQTRAIPLPDDTIKVWDLRLRNGHGNYRDHPLLDIGKARNLILRNDGKADLR